MYEKPDLIDEYVSKGGHAYRPDLRVAIFKFLNKHLKNDTSTVKDADFPPIAGAELRVFPEDKDMPTDALNGKIDETFVAKANVPLPEEGKFDAWKEKLLKELHEKCFRDFPERVPAGRLVGAVSDKDGHFVMRTAPGITTRVGWEEGKFDKPLTFVVLGGDDPGIGTPKWCEETFAGEMMLGSPRGHGKSTFTHKNPPNYVERAHALLGQTVDEMRVWDAIAMYREYYTNIPNERKLKWQVAGRGQAGVLAAYAGLWEPDIKELILVEPPISHRDGPYFLNVLRVLDIPDALGMLAPKPLTIYSNDKAFERTAEIYKRAGAADKFKQLPVKK